MRGVIDTWGLGLRKRGPLPIFYNISFIYLFIYNISYISYKKERVLEQTQKNITFTS